MAFTSTCMAPIIEQESALKGTWFLEVELPASKKY